MGEFNRMQGMTSYWDNILWGKVVFLSFVHIIALYSITILPNCNPRTLIFVPITYVLSGLGVTAGAHRLWSHRSYQAKLPLRIILAIFNCSAWQVPILQWCRDHRTHHKFSETDGDPHNASRGFFFSHIGCMLVKKHPEVIKRGKTIDLSDLYNDPVVMVQKRFFLPAAIFTCVILPTFVPWYFWGESLWNAYCIAIFRHCLLLNSAFAVNSFAHMFGNKPYDSTIRPSENKMVSIFALGEGFHNYHHVFPQDYKTGEFGFNLNLTAIFIDFMALLGQAYNRRTISKDMIQTRRKRTGNLSSDDKISDES